jgi:glutamine amidotransferase
MVDVAVVDYGMGNLRSVEQALRKVAPESSVVVTDDARVIASAGRVVFPGQGAMPDCMREMDVRGLRDAVLDAAHDKPFLGICIGLQMLFEHSAEGDVAGLGVFPGDVVRFAHNLKDARGDKLKVPHMGWNQVQRIEHPASPRGDATIAPSPASGTKAGFREACFPPPESDGDATPSVGRGAGLGRGSSLEHPLWAEIEQNARFYFVHSYYVQPQDAAFVQATSDYPQAFVCAVAKDNLFAVQFHPEKSAAAGLQLLQNFVNWNPL